jgi:hypothetical protein
MSTPTQLDLFIHEINLQLKPITPTDTTPQSVGEVVRTTQPVQLELFE